MKKKRETFEAPAVDGGAFSHRQDGNADESEGDERGPVDTLHHVGA